MRKWVGKAVSPGFAEGAAVVYAAGSADVIPRYEIDVSSIEAERERLRSAVAGAHRDLEELRREIAARVGESDAAIFATHIAFLDDKSFRGRIEERIAREAVNAEQAVEAEMTEITAKMAGLEDDYLRERAQDIRDVARRIIGHLLPSTLHGLADLPSQAVIVATELLPSETAHLDRRHVQAIITERGSKTSHAAILAKALGIPAVTGVTGACEKIRAGAPMLVDGCRGTVVMDPSEQARTAFVRGRDEYLRLSAAAAKAEERECVTRDDVRIELYANLGRIAETPDVHAHHLLGVGLFRTEVLFLESSVPPTREIQRAAYRSVAEKLGELPLIIRTFDLGGDKHPDFLPLPSAHNPSIGLRGMRFALRETGLLRTQLAAILDVAREHPVSVLFPMVIAGDDLSHAVDLLHQVAEEQKCNRLPPVGAMIETPSSVFALPEIMRSCDFLSIGTNDLTQFILAADRDAADLLDEFSILHPSVLRAVDMVVRQAASQGMPVTVCGEAAGDPEIAPLLVGLGVRKLSMSPLRAARVRMVLRQSRLDALERLAREALACNSVEAVRERLERSAADHQGR